MTLSITLPAAEDISLETLLARLDRDEAGLPPFAPEITAAMATLSGLLLRDRQARQFAELQSLGFWLRPAAIERLRRDFLAAEPDAVRVPRGTVLHIPPSNVDTIFVYSWALSMLAGNRNIVRLPSRRARQVDLLLGLLGTVLAQHPALAPSTIMLGYGHDDAVTTALSAKADVRVIWGGDRTVNHIRSLALPPHATELTFPDRFSLAAFAADAVLALDEPGLVRLADAFFNDVYWFDQMACSSPRQLYWIGSAEAGRAASVRFRQALAAAIDRRGYELNLGAAVEKVTLLCRAILDLPVAEVWQQGSALAVLMLDEVADLRAAPLGGGTLFELVLPELAALAPLVRRKDQTLSHFGFSGDALRDLARRINGRGIDRMVPVGDALAFGHVWDGVNLLTELTRLVAIK